jgi:SAM-dependent methyltransferase
MDSTPFESSRVPDGYSDSVSAVYARLFSRFTSELVPRIYEYFVGHTERRDGASLLDLCCGTGVVAEYFAKQGVRVLGLDVSPAMLRAAATRLAPEVEAGLVVLREADARRFTVEEPVDACVSTDNSINHIGGIDALRDCARCVKAALRPGGWFLFDVNTRRRIVAGNGSRIVDTRETFQLWRNIVDEEAGVAYSNVNGFLQQPDGSYSRFTLTYRNWILDFSEMRAALLADGWRSVKFLSPRNFDVTLDDAEMQSIVMVLAET